MQASWRHSRPETSSFQWPAFSGYLHSDPTNIVRGQLDDVARIFSRMTAVDGATLITRDLNVIGFGVKLKAAPDPAEPPVIYKIDPLHNEGRITSVELSSLGGMRHQS